MDPDSLLDIAVDLLRIPSTADRPGDLRRAVDFVVDFLGPGFVVERFESRGKPSALCYAVRDRPPGAAPARPEFRVILNGHVDVVPAAPAQFQPRLVGDRLYARGAQDMKVSALVQALVLRELADVLPYPLALQVVADEEVGGRDGTLHQLRAGVRGAFVIIGEHSRLDVVADSKGFVHATLHARGSGGHGAYPWLGDNALLTLMRGIEALLARYPVRAPRQWRTTVNVARIETPNRAFNQIPEDAWAWLDIRFPPDDPDFNGLTRDEIVGRLQSRCGPGVTVVVDHVEPPHHADHESPDVIALRAAARGQGFPGELLVKHGAADARFYSARGVPAVIFGVGGDGQHGPDEYVDISTVAPYHDALSAFLRDVAARESDEQPPPPAAPTRPRF